MVSIELSWKNGGVSAASMVEAVLKSESPKPPVGPPGRLGVAPVFRDPPEAAVAREDVGGDAGRQVDAEGLKRQDTAAGRAVPRRPWRAGGCPHSPSLAPPLVWQAVTASVAEAGFRPLATTAS